MRNFLVRYVLSAFILTMTAAQASALSFALSTSEGGTLYLGDSAQAQSLFLIDTGSSMTILTQATFEQIKRQQEVTEAGLVIAKLANGRKQTVQLYNVPVLTLTDECQFNNVSVAVMNKKHNILGMEVLSRAAPISIALAPATLTLNQCDNSHTAMNESTVRTDAR
ncbi:retropepsin-like aspartic protease [Alteromonas gilva]|uniref:Retroviral-like aspartic protease family protein n=1 Tax=Alteromonas gilva TaxID=2987522 RepID=A0ABT5L2T0_9ALTE|nr:retroviral-like aspartic protease family protein [Alteromonas gilva]MDC8830786.1 retroviral-like aspartic protease family protein [Alteromonas gilva]